MKNGNFEIGAIAFDCKDINPFCLVVTYKGKQIFTFAPEEMAQLANLMADYFNIGIRARNELSDSELMDELKARGYTGVLRTFNEFTL